MVAERREAFFGLIAPIGVNLDSVESALSHALDRVAYTTNCVRLTKIFDDLGDKYKPVFSDEYDRYVKLIQIGDDLCKDTGRNDIMALYGIERLKTFSERGKDDEIPQNVVHLFRQIKRVEEIRTLKDVFGRNILFVACYSSKADRVDNLVKKLLKSHRGVSRARLEAKALDIIAIDENEADKPSGQRVLDCYPSADFVIDCSSASSLAKSANRLIDIYFGHPFVSPTKDEYCSYFANAASYRSLDLSRQVGAAIFTDNCEVVALGCNEVPKSGGGTYWDDSANDMRDYAVGHDSNQQVKQDMAGDALARLKKHWLTEPFKSMETEELAYRALLSPSAPLRGAMIADVIEYGRMVHAEMNAITDAARSRKSTQDATLYCTTMPCHLCTKLVIASGIKRVVYVQPYPKSLVDELFKDSVSIDEGVQAGKVVFETLKGVTPNGFRIAFRKSGKRKNADGTTVNWKPLTAIPTFLSFFPYYRSLEISASLDFARSLAKAVPAIQQSLFPDEEL